MNISEINHIAKASKKPRRVGRGTGSGRGKTSQRGHKGQGSRSGSSMNPVFEGGQMPLVRRIPKRGFNNKRFADTIVAVNVGDLALIFESTDAITPDSMREKGVAKKTCDQIKVLGDGELTKALNISAHKFSASALEKIKAAGGTATVLPGTKPVVKNKMGTRRKAAQAAAIERKEKAKGKVFPKKSAKKTVKTSKPKK